MTNREVSDVDAEFASLIGARVIAYQQQAAWTSAKARDYLNMAHALGLPYHERRAVAYQRESEIAAMRAAYWLLILIDGTF